jgi:hypothetical protein
MLSPKKSLDILRKTDALLEGIGTIKENKKRKK